MLGEIMLLECVARQRASMSPCSIGHALVADHQLSHGPWTSPPPHHHTTTRARQQHEPVDRAPKWAQHRTLPLAGHAPHFVAYTSCVITPHLLPWSLLLCLRTTRRSAFHFFHFTEHRTPGQVKADLTGVPSVNLTEKILEHWWRRLGPAIFSGLSS